MFRTTMALAAIAFVFFPAAAQDVKMSETVKGLVKKLMDATVEGNYRLVLDMTHPKVLDMMGGKEKAIQEVEKSMKMIKEQGFTFKIKEIGEPALVKGDKDHYSATGFTLIMTGRGKKITSKSAVIGVSTDAGKSWKFINLDGKGEAGARTIIPDLPNTLVIPKQEQKVEDNS